MKIKATALFAALLPAFLLAGPQPAAFALDPWEFEVYPYKTVGEGMLELETLNAVPVEGHGEPDAGLGHEFPSRHQWFNSYEVTYGLTDQIEVAAYANFSLPANDDYQFAGSKYRLRGSLFHEGALPVDIGWYVEMEQHRTPQFDDDKAELELRPIIEKQFGPIDVRLNPIFEKPLANAGWEFGSSSGIYYRAVKEISPGLEYYNDLGPISNNDPSSEQQHYLMPVIFGEIGHGIEYSTGVGFGLTEGSDDVVVKVNVELEKYIGSLF